MEDRQPSQTALAAAAARAAHLVVDHEPLIFQDLVAADLIGEPGAEMVAYHRQSGDHIVLSGTRTQVTVRSRWAERRLAALAAGGLAQYVDFGHPALEARPARRRRHRDPGRPGVRRRRPGDRPAGRAPGRRGLRPVRPGPGELAGDQLLPHTRRRRRHPGRGGGLAAGTELVMEYALPPELRDETGQAYAEFAPAVAADRGEPWLSFFTPDQLAGLLAGHGLAVAEQVRQQDAVPADLWRRSDVLRPADLCRLARATVSSRRT